MKRNLTLDEFCGLSHTLLKPDATPQEIQRVCDEAREYGFASVCVKIVMWQWSMSCLLGWR